MLPGLGILPGSKSFELWPTASSCRNVWFEVTNKNLIFAQTSALPNLKFVKVDVIYLYDIKPVLYVRRYLDFIC